ncbi:MAG: MopE-related protein, partial [bacterium]
MKMSNKIMHFWAATAAVVVALAACSDPTLDPSADGGGLRDAFLPTPGFDAGAGGAGGLSPGCVAEVCDALDNDCDGRVDEIACPCSGPATCFAGPAQARGVGTCTEGLRACDATGESYGPCEGSVGPGPEACNGLDDDCDGVVDEWCDQPGAGGAGGGAGGAGGEGVPGQPRQERFRVGEERLGRPVDFILSVDNSGSMDDTVAQVEANLGTLATRLVEAGIDYHVVLISERGTNPRDPDVCIPPPMAGPQCADTDRFLHLDESVDSEEPFEDIVKCWNGCDGGRSFSGFLREGSLLQFIIVTDDESDMSWPRFSAFVRNDMQRPEYVVHGVVGLEDRGCVADVGEQYIRGAQDTGGELLHICDNDWGRVIQVLLDATVVRLQRSFPLAGLPD